jgi:hypothetical protein
MYSVDTVVGAISALIDVLNKTLNYSSTAVDPNYGSKVLEVNLPKTSFCGRAKSLAPAV